MLSVNSVFNVETNFSISSNLFLRSSPRAGTLVLETPTLDTVLVGAVVVVGFLTVELEVAPKGLALEVVVGFERADDVVVVIGFLAKLEVGADVVEVSVLTLFAAGRSAAFGLVFVFKEVVVVVVGALFVLITPNGCLYYVL